MLIKRKSSKNFFLLFQWNSFIKIKNKVLWLLHSLTRNDSNNKYILIRHFSQVTKSRILKNLNLRKKADRNFRRTFMKNRFRHLKLYSNPPSWLVVVIWAPFERRKIEVHIFERANYSDFDMWNVTVKEDLNWRKQVFLLNFTPWSAQKPKIWSIFYGN